MFTKIVKRNSSDTLIVEVISNGYLCTVNGRDNEDSWGEEKIYVTNIDGIAKLIKDFAEMEVI